MRDILIFAVGAAIGADVAYMVAKSRYEKRAQEDIDKMREVYKKKIEETEDEPVIKEESEDVEYYTDMVGDLYGSDTENKPPYQITEEQYDESRLDHDKLVLTYYEGCGTLADDDIVFKDADYCIGRENLALFDDADVIYIRNEKAGCDYEVHMDHGTYEDRYPQEFEEY